MKVVTVDSSNGGFRGLAGPSAEELDALDARLDKAYSRYRKASRAGKISEGLEHQLNDLYDDASRKLLDLHYGRPAADFAATKEAVIRYEDAVRRFVGAGFPVRPKTIAVVGGVLALGGAAFAIALISRKRRR